MTQEVLKLALEWAEANGEIVFAGGGMDAVNKMNSWATAIKEALAQTERHELQAKSEHPAPCARHCEATAFGIVIKNLKAQLAQKQEPIAMLFGSLPVYDRTTPPQRTWVGLTDEEENEYNYLGPDMYWVIQEIEAKLKEKNT